MTGPLDGQPVLKHLADCQFGPVPTWFDCLWLSWMKASELNSMWSSWWVNSLSWLPLLKFHILTSPLLEAVIRRRLLLSRARAVTLQQR